MMIQSNRVYVITNGRHDVRSDAVYTLKCWQDGVWADLMDGYTYGPILQRIHHSIQPADVYVEDLGGEPARAFDYTDTRLPADAERQLLATLNLP